MVKTWKSVWEHQISNIYTRKQTQKTRCCIAAPKLVAISSTCESHLSKTTLGPECGACTSRSCFWIWYLTPNSYIFQDLTSLSQWHVGSLTCGQSVKSWKACELGPKILNFSELWGIKQFLSKRGMVKHRGEKIDAWVVASFTDNWGFTHLQVHSWLLLRYY